MTFIQTMLPNKMYLTMMIGKNGCLIRRELKKYWNSILILISKIDLYYYIKIPGSPYFKKNKFQPKN